MALSGTLVKETSIKSHGDGFLGIFCYRPYDISNMSPQNIKGVEILNGQWGSVGSVINWNYSLDGKDCVAKEVIEANDWENKLIRFKVVGGTLLDFYQSFFLTINVDTKGAEHLVTWTLTYEKLNENVEDPNTVMRFCLDVTNDIDTHQPSISI